MIQDELTQVSYILTNVMVFQCPLTYKNSTMSNSRDQNI